MYEFDKTFDRKVFLGHCDLISWFSDFCLISRHSVGIFSSPEPLGSQGELIGWP